MASQTSHPLTPIADQKIVDAVLEAVEQFDLTAVAAWQALDGLSSHTRFEEMDAAPEGIFSRDDGNFEIVATAYVTLVYGDKADATTLADAYPAKVIGHLDGQKFVVDDVAVDTSAFYE